MPYAVVQDVPASWDHYAQLAAVLGNPGPDGLILHVAGPTDEGYRTIEVWETRDAWRRFLAARIAFPPPGVVAAAPTSRELDAITSITGPGAGARATER